MYEDVVQPVELVQRMKGHKESHRVIIAMVLVSRKKQRFQELEEGVSAWRIAKGGDNLLHIFLEVILHPEKEKEKGSPGLPICL